MCFFFFVSFSFSISFEFNDETFKEKLQPSQEKPIIAVFYTPDCFDCYDTEAYFSQLETNKSNAIYSLINCRNTTICDTYSITNLPRIFYISSPERNKWKSSSFTSFPDVENFLKENKKIKIKKLFDDVNISVNDRTVYFISAATEKDDLLDEIRRHQLKKYRDNQFLYKIEKGNEKDSFIRAYLTETCFIDKPSKNPKETVPSFIEKTQYASIYHYDDNDLEITKNNNKLLLITKDLSKIQKEFLCWVQNQYCGKIFTGYSNDQTAPNFIKSNNLTTNDFPVLIFSNDKCTSYYKGRIRHIKESKFIEDSLHGKSCGKTYGLKI